MLEQLTVERITAWRADPVLMVRQLFEAEPDHWQVAALREWADPAPRKRIALQACAGPGKSSALAWMGWNGMICHAHGDDYPNGAAVSITGDNLRNNLWKELAKWRERAPLVQRWFDMTSERIFEREHPQTWRLDARSFAKSADTEAQGRTLSGLHARAIFYLVDESGDMPPAVGRAADQGLTNCAWGRIAQAGNPTSHTGMLYVSVNDQSHRWTVIRITGDPDDPHRSQRIDIEEAREAIKQYGRENPWVMAYILGQFPPTSMNALLGPDEVRDAMRRELRPDEYDWAQKRLGIDVARFGDDRTVIQARQGLNARIAPVVMRHARANDIAARVLQAKAKWGSELEAVDDTGTWGAGVIDNLVTAGYSPIGIPFSAPALDPRYKNRRAEMWITMADWVKRGGALPNVPELVAELTTPTYTFLNGKMQLEEKDQIKKRLGRSPDLADALALTFALPDMPGAMQELTHYGETPHAKTEWDTYGEDR